MSDPRAAKARSREISKRIDKAIFEYRMIRPGDRILVGLSGGKDSATLVYHLGQKARSFSIPFEVAAYHVSTELEEAGIVSRLSALCGHVGVPLAVRSLRLANRLQPGRTATCYWCATQRRTELLRFATEEGFGTIALGHQLEDHLETFIMNMMRRGELSTMLPVMSYRKYDQTVIRPLVWVRETETHEFASDIGFDAVQCACGLDASSTRRNARSVLRAMVAEEGEAVKERLLQALHTPRVRYLIRRSSGAGDHVGRGYQGALHELPP